MPPYVEDNVSCVRNKKHVTNSDNETDANQVNEYKLSIVWENVAIMTYLHLAALYGVYLCFTSAQINTILSGKLFSSHPLSLQQSS